MANVVSLKKRNKNKPLVHAKISDVCTVARTFAGDRSQDLSCWAISMSIEKPRVRSREGQELNLVIFGIFLIGAYIFFRVEFEKKSHEGESIGNARRPRTI